MSITKRISTLLVVSVVCTLGFFTGCDWVRWSSRGTSNTADRIKIPPPINALLPQRIEVHPFTRIGLLSERGDIHGIDLCIRAVDSYGDATKAFGKFSPRRRRGLRRYEQEMGIVERNAWRSVFPSVQNLLDHLRRYTKSASSREKYLCQVAQFCRWARMGPEDLVKLPKTRIELLIQDWVDGMEELGRSRSYLNCVIKRLRTFFHANGFVGEKELNIRTYFMPTRYRKVPEYIPTKEEVYCMANAVGNTRDRAIILCLFSSGLRVSTLLALLSLIHI